MKTNLGGDKMIKIGKVTNTHGLKGEIRILSHFKYKDVIFKIGNVIYINNEALEINSYRVHKEYDMVTLKGYNNIDNVLKFKGKNVYIDENDYRFPGILNEELIGLDVYENDKYIGKITDVITNNYQELIVIDNKYLIPYVSEFIKEIKKDKVQINLIKGLINED